MNASSNAERQILVIEDEQDLASLLVLHLSELPARMGESGRSGRRTGADRDG
jgi:hypothetical protein